MIDTKTVKINIRKKIDTKIGVGAGAGVVTGTSIRDGNMTSLMMTINTMILNINGEIIKMITKFQRNDGNPQLVAPTSK